MRNGAAKFEFASALLLGLLALATPQLTARVQPPPPGFQLACSFEARSPTQRGADDRLELRAVPTGGDWHQPWFVVRDRAGEPLTGATWSALDAPFALVPAIELHLADFAPLPVSSAELLRAWQLKTRWEWLEGRFRIERGDPWSTLRFKSSQGSFQTSTLRPERFGIQEGETYRVQVRFVYATEPEIERVERGSVVIYDASICELHGERMTRFPVPITWGHPTDWNYHPSAGRTLSEDELARFPHYLERLNGGCVKFRGMSDTADVYICPACVSAFQRLRK